MTLIKKITLAILLVIFIAPLTFAKEDAKPLNYQDLKKKFISEQLIELVKLKGQIKSSYVKDATSLAKALIHLEKKHYGAAESILKKNKQKNHPK